MHSADRFWPSLHKETVAVLDEHGQVSVASLATGEVTWLQEGVVYSNAGKCKLLIPTWRSTNEITCVVLMGGRSGSPGRM